MGIKMEVKVGVKVEVKGAPRIFHSSLFAFPIIFYLFNF